MKSKSKKKDKKEAATPPEPEPKASSKSKKKSSSKTPPPPPVHAPVNGASTGPVVRQSDPLVTNKSTIPDEADFNLPQHTPSYVGISCAILGYGLYNRYNGSPGPSLQVSSLPAGPGQVGDEVDSTGPVTRLIAQFEKLKKEQAEKAAAEYQINKSLDETLAAQQGEFLPTLSPPREAPVKKYPPVITETKTKPDETITKNQIKKEPVIEVQIPPPTVVEAKQIVQEVNLPEEFVERKVEESKAVQEPSTNRDIKQTETQIKSEKEYRDEHSLETGVKEETNVLKHELLINEEVVISSKRTDDIEQVAVLENVICEEDTEDVSLVLSESKSEHMITSQSPVLDDQSDSDTGSVRIHDTPEPSESHQEHIYSTNIQESSSPVLVQSSEQEIMKQGLPEFAQILEQDEVETVEDELSTRVQVSDSNEEVMMREAPIGSTSSRKTSIDSDVGSGEVLVRDGKWFLSQYELVCDEVRRKITQAESDLEKYSNQMNDDVEGRVRAGIGKANLLITSKLKQFHDLCIKNIENSMTDGCETKIEDLEGYWEMVSYQIEDVHHTLGDIDSMKHNNWTVVPEQEFLSHETQKAKPKKKSTSALSSEDEEAAAVKEEARKARLREAKRLQAEKLATAQHEEVLIFAPPTTGDSDVDIVSSPSPLSTDPPLVAVQTENQELIEIESSNLTSHSTENAPPKEPGVLVDLLS